MLSVFVMPGLVPGIHVLVAVKTWMASLIKVVPANAGTHTAESL